MCLSSILLLRCLCCCPQCGWVSSLYMLCYWPLLGVCIVDGSSIYMLCGCFVTADLQFDEPIINEAALDAVKNFFSFGKK
mmetsp:Transcript_1430/g.4145  ORF Transcript_1430/g.4145 Transcript_1430/m.4145 type:complete len:80 (+) Transcript_1430:1144-1383(+)